MKDATPLLILAPDQSSGQPLAALLLQQRYHVDVCCNPEAALTQAQQHPWAALLLITDPAGVALSTCAALANGPALADVPILCVASQDESHTAADYFAVGAVDYLPYPWLEADLLARLACRCQAAHRWRRLQAEVQQQRLLGAATWVDPDPAAITAALQDSEARYRALVEALPDLLIRMDRTGTYLEVIPGRQSKLHQPAVDKVGLNIQAFLPPAVAAQQLAAAQAALANDTVQVFEQQLTLNGCLYHEEVSVVPCRHDEVLLVVRDVTGRRQVTAALQRTEAQQQAILKAIPDLMFCLDRQGIYHDFVPSESVVNLVGGPARVLGRSLTDCLPPDLAQRHLEAVQRVTATGEMLTYEHQIKTPQGWRDEEVRVVPIGPEEALFMVRDITERKQTEAALQASEATNRALLRAIPDLLIRIRRDGRRLALFGSQQVRLLGEADAHIGEPISNQLPPELAARRLRAIQAALDTGELQVDEYAITVDGEQRYEEARVVPVNADEVLVMVRDISDRRRQETELRTAKEAAEAANRAKSAFLANVSHELRTPLHAVLGFAQLLAEGPNLTATQRQNLDIILQSGQHLLQALNDILDLSQLEADQIQVERESFDLEALLQEIATTFRLPAAKQQLQFEVQPSADLPRYIWSDRHKLITVLSHLVSNALKFTERGQVTLTAERLWDDTLPPTQTLLLFCVHDTGPGLAPEELPHLFDPFVQIQMGHHKPAGTGLGLAICRRYLQLLGSQIEVTSQLSQGSQFQFELLVELGDAVAPLAAGPPEPAPAPSPGQLDLTAALAATPARWRTDAAQALLSLDSARIEEVIAELPPQQADLAAQLRQYADDFRYDTILEWLQTELG